MNQQSRLWKKNIDLGRELYINLACVSQQSIACRALKYTFKIDWVNNTTDLTTHCETHPSIFALKLMMYVHELVVEVQNVIINIVLFKA